MRRALALAVAATLLIAAGGGEPPLRLATYAYPKYDRAKALAPLAGLLRETTGRRVEVRVLDTPEALRDAVLAGEADVAVPNLASFLGMSRNTEARAIAGLDVPAAVLDKYRGVLVARRDAGLTRLEDVAAGKGRLRLAEVLPGSTSGALVQQARLRQLGVEPSHFASVHQSGTHDAALADVIAGKAHLAALAEEPWRKLQNEQPSAAAQLVELWRSAPLPPGPIVCVRSSHTPCDRIRTALLRGGKSAGAARALAAGWSEYEGASAFVEVDADAYRGFLPGG